MQDIFYLNGYGVYVYAAITAALLPMSSYACWIYCYYYRARQRLHD